MVDKRNFRRYDMFIRKRQEIKDCKFCKRTGTLKSNVLDFNKSKISIVFEEIYLFVLTFILSRFSVVDSIYWLLVINFVLIIFRLLDSIIVNKSLLEIYCKFAMRPSLIDYWNCSRCNRKSIKVHPIKFLVAPVYNTLLMIVSLILEELL